MTERGSAGWLESEGITTLDASELARLVDRTSERELRHRLIGGVREVALREIFRRMPEYLRPARAAGFDAVISWQITGAGGDGHSVDEYWIHVHDSRCTVSSTPPAPADISIRTDPATLLRIVTGNEDPIVAVLKQRLSVRGDLAQAARLTKLFAVGPA
ncbi:SCP2 sterol-binding domain-containing protein [Kribbella jiaozuonensis]|uniref:SCP2 sterol-binding domain-containing protein n=1 Tax=Kribbella jiaozuonensis TaxID=2575441 RepID=A0A4U3M0X6_9ACTN|nr:SCP2 sterol-binding domain-containing protein [Kribbella jiaozuonensis]TKK82201.1 SCP2 sterol-binding domain-containing protein [Kribbella jiaozuonensis]